MGLHRGTRRWLREGERDGGREADGKAERETESGRGKDKRSMEGMAG